jgi:hypothetical protein
LTNGFIGDGDASFGEKFFHLTKTEAEPMVQPDGVTDNFRGKPVTLLAGCWLFHAVQSAKPLKNGSVRKPQRDFLEKAAPLREEYGGTFPSLWGM